MTVNAPSHGLSIETLQDLLAVAEAQHGEAIAVRGPEGRGLASVSYRELSERSARFRDEISATVKQRDFVVLCAHNSNAWVAAFFGIVRAGAVPVPVNPDAPDDVLDGILDEVDPSAVIGDRGSLPRLRRERLPAVDLDVAPRTSAQPRPDAEASPGDLAALIYTTGTTGRPKGVMLTHRNLTSNAAAIAELASLQGDDVVLVVLPLYHSFPLTVGMLAPILAGVRIELEARPTRIASRLREARPTHLIGVPALYELLLARVRREAERRPARWYFDTARRVNEQLIRRFGLNAGRLLFRPVHRALGGRLRIAISGGARLAPELQREAFVLGLPLLQGFGMSEAAPVVAAQRFDGRRFWRSRYYWDHIGSCGPPMPGVTVEIEPIAGADPGVGEIIVRGPNVMVGYYRRDEETRTALRDGALHTGDLGTLDAEGELWIRGRLGLAVSGPRGKIVHLERVEEAIAREPAVEQVAVIVEEEPDWHLVAIVHPSAEVDAPAASVEAIRSRLGVACNRACNALEAHERVSEVRLTDTPLPMTPLGKLRRREIPPTVGFDLARWRALIRDGSQV